VSAKESSGEAAEPGPPLLRVIRGGEPTPDELAALVTVIAARSATPAVEPEPLRKPLGAWVVSGLVKGTRTKV
jgi:hypothetical protein